MLEMHRKDPRRKREENVTEAVFRELMIKTSEIE